MNVIQSDKYIRVSKTKVKSLIKKNRGLKVAFLPCKVNINNSNWFQLSHFYIETIEELNDIINSYTFYNCNWEQGYYISFYINK